MSGKTPKVDKSIFIYKNTNNDKDNCFIYDDLGICNLKNPYSKQKYLDLKRQID